MTVLEAVNVNPTPAAVMLNRATLSVDLDWKSLTF